MAKPRVKHPGFSAVDRSPQGEIFMSLLMSFLGDKLDWKAVEQTRDRSVVFLIGGPRGWGVLVEAKSQAQQDRWEQRWGFRFQPEDLGVVIQIEYVAYRWDPWLAAELTGDHTVLGDSLKGRRRIREVKDREIGSEGDRLHLTVLPLSTASRSICGVPMDLVERALEKYTQSEGNSWPDAPGDSCPVESPTWDPALLGANFPLVD